MRATRIALLWNLIAVCLLFALAACGGGSIAGNYGGLSGGNNNGNGASLVSISLSSSNPELRAGSTTQLIATGSYSDGSSQNVTSLASWSSSNTAAATVSNATGSNGFVSALGQGSATITASYGGVTGNADLSIAALPTGEQMGGGIQLGKLDLPAPVNVSTYAGSPLFTGYVNATGDSSRFATPVWLTSDGTNLYVEDQANYVIRKIAIGSGIVTTLAGTAGTAGSNDGIGTAASFGNMKGITTDGTNLYVLDDGTLVASGSIRKIVIATGAVSTFAGSTTAAGSTDGTGTAALFKLPSGITTDGVNLYVSDTINNTIRQVVLSTGVVTTIAGKVGVNTPVDGTGSGAGFGEVVGISTDGVNLYMTDAGAYTVRKMVIATGAVSTMAGSTYTMGTADGTGSAAEFEQLTGITTDGTNLYLTDGNAVRQLVIATGVVTTLAGVVTDEIGVNSVGTTDGTGSSARFNFPRGITTDGLNLYIADSNNDTIRELGAAASSGVPAIPAGFSAGSNGSSSVSLSWPEAQWAVCYDVFISTSPTFSAGTTLEYSCVTDPGSLTSLTDGSAYYVKVVAVNGYGDSLPSAAYAFTFTSSSSSGGNSSGSLVGTWVATDDSSESGASCQTQYTLTFGSDGSFSYAEQGACGPVGGIPGSSSSCQASGTYTASGGSVAITFTAENLNGTACGPLNNIDTSYTITGSDLTLAGDNEVYVKQSGG